MKKTGFVYKWTNNINKRWYIGSHKGSTDDGYRHSSKPMLAAENKYGLENFTREILFEGDYEQNKIRSVIEPQFLQEEDAANNPMSYNLSNISGLDCWSDETNQKRSNAKLGSKNPNWGKPAWNRGIPCSKVTKAKISVKNKGKRPSEEHRTKNSLAQVGNTYGRANKGKIPWNKGKIGVQVAWNKDKKIGPQKKVQCPYCDKKGAPAPMHRWHFDNCKIKP